MRESVCKTLKFYDLFLRHNLTGIADRPLPEGYSFRFYQPGDEENWLEIEASAREFLCPEEGREAWRQYFGGKEEELKRRMLFIVDAGGMPVATSTAFYDPKDEKAGWVHWVAVRREHQGKGLSKPLILRTLLLLKDMGYPYACLHTQTVTWLAVKVYLDCGFLPWQGAKEGWRIIRTLTGHKKLTAYDMLAETEMYDPLMLEMEEKIRQKFPDVLDCSVWTEGNPRAVVRVREGVLYFELIPDGKESYRLGAFIS